MRTKHYERKLKTILHNRNVEALIPIVEAARTMLQQRTLRQNIIVSYSRCIQSGTEAVNFRDSKISDL